MIFIWLKEKTGREFHVRLNMDLPLRKGQTVYIIDVTKEKETSRGFLYNASTKQLYFLLDKEYRLFNNLTTGKALRELTKSFAKFFLYCLIVVFAIGKIQSFYKGLSDDFWIGVFVIYGIYRFFIKKGSDVMDESAGLIGVTKTAPDVVKEAVADLIIELDKTLELPPQQFS